MKIGILGAPGSGKTLFAHSLAKLVEGVVIDNYVGDLRAQTGLEYGPFGNHVDDLQVVFKRREEEFAMSEFDPTITVGTVLDSAMHCFVREDAEARTRREVGLHQERLRTIAATFGLLYTDTWDYDYAFLLNYEGDSVHGKKVAAGLVELIQTYRAPVLSFSKDIANDEKASTAARAITALESEQLPTPQERGVRRGSEAGEPDGDSAESVPDVPEQRGISDDA